MEMSVFLLRSPLTLGGKRKGRPSGHHYPERGLRKRGGRRRDLHGGEREGGESLSSRGKKSESDVFLLVVAAGQRGKGEEGRIL